MITSTNNSRVKNIIQLNKKIKARKEQGVYVVEGVKMFSEAPRECIREVYVTELFIGGPEHQKLLDGINYEVVEERVFTQMADTKTPQGILCTIQQYRYELEDLLSNKPPFLLILEDLQDPGNVGTIFRTAEGAGVDGIILSKNCVDIYNPKTIRSTMGSIYRIPFYYTDEVEQVALSLKERGIRTYAAHLDGRNNYHQEDYRCGTAFFIGNEGKGLSRRVTENAECLVRIPMAGKLESLNAAVASAILMYEVRRQRESNI